MRKKLTIENVKAIRKLKEFCPSIRQRQIEKRFGIAHNSGFVSAILNYKVYKNI